jgi:hypothetical protein
MRLGGVKNTKVIQEGRGDTVGDKGVKGDTMGGKEEIKADVAGEKGPGEKGKKDNLKGDAGGASGVPAIPGMPDIGGMIPPEFVKSLRKNIQAADEIAQMKDTSMSILKKTKGLLDSYQPLITPIANTFTRLPCTAARKYADMVCQPTIALQHGLKYLFQVAQRGGRRYTHENYNMIYDPVYQRNVPLTSSKGRAVLMAYYGYVMYQGGHTV